jgi:phosphinothricin acetyltransferase
MNAEHRARQDVVIRDATSRDLAAINDIYNHYVLHSTCTYQVEPETMAAREAWFRGRDPQHPVLVAQTGDEVAAWGSLSPWGTARRRQVFRRTVEDSIYVRRDMHGRGLGSAMLGALIERARRLGHRSMLAVVSGEQAPSIRLHRKFGFAEVGRLREIAEKFGRVLDVVYLQKRL